jgi:hypothetical protein
MTRTLEGIQRKNVIKEVEASAWEYVGISGVKKPVSYIYARCTFVNY